MVQPELFSNRRIERHSKQLARSYTDRRAAEAVVDAALICREELGEGEVSREARQLLIEALFQNPLLTAQLFSDCKRR